jgi:hypothetical protein
LTACARGNRALVIVTGNRHNNVLRIKSVTVHANYVKVEWGPEGPQPERGGLPFLLDDEAPRMDPPTMGRARKIPVAFTVDRL